jgi:hypothetical protein
MTEKKASYMNDSNLRPNIAKCCLCRNETKSIQLSVAGPLRLSVF